MKFLNILVVGSIACATINVAAKTGVAPAQTYYAHDAKKMRGCKKVVAFDYNQVLVQKYNKKPLMSTITIYKQFVGSEPFAVWTNCPAKDFTKNQKRLRKKYTGGYMRPAFVFNKDKMRKKGSKKHYRSERFFIDAYHATMCALGLDPKSTVFIFIDDSAKNIRDARTIAKRFGLNIIAIQYKNAVQLAADLAWVYSM